MNLPLPRRRRPHLGRVEPSFSYMEHKYVRVGVPDGYRVQFDGDLLAYRLVPSRSRRTPVAA